MGGKKIKGINADAMHEMASNMFADVIHSFATDLLKGLLEDGNLQDLDRAIATVNSVTGDIVTNGIKLRKANIERRTKAKKEAADDNGVIEKENVKWKKYPGNKRLEYTMDICINGKYPLKKRKEDIVVALLTEDQLEDYDGEIGRKMSSKEKQKLFTMGLLSDVE
jgi:hypothetical protein